MKVLKPSRLGVLFRSFEHEHRNYFVVTVFAFVPLDDCGELLPEQAMWKFVPKQLAKGEVLDEGMPKARGEVLVTGSAFPVGRKPSAAVAIRVKVGAIDKTLHVVGNRAWRKLGVTAPEPFVQMPVDWAHAYGGPDFAENPIGKGRRAAAHNASASTPLANIEDPKQPIRKPDERVAPSGLSAIPLGWPQRMNRAGTYDAQWLKALAPGFAADVDWTLFNTAPPDQILSDFFEGGEAFAIENMHADKPRIEGRLRPLRVRAFVNVRRGAGDELTLCEVSTRLDTVRFFPHAERAVLVFRGVTRVAEDDARDVEHLLVACETSDDARPREHYESVFHARLDPNHGAMASLRDEDLIAASIPKPRKTEADSDVPPRTGAFKANLQRRAARDLEEQRERLVALGIDPARLATKEPPSVRASIESAQASIQGLADRKKAILDAARTGARLAGIDLDAKLAEAATPRGGPPAFRARAALAQLEGVRARLAAAGQPTAAIDARLADPALHEKFAVVESSLLETYRKTAHRMPPASHADSDARVRVREQIAAQHAERVSFEDRDLTGCDLAGLDLRGAVFRRALLEGADFSGANLAGADFRGAVLARAKFDRADLSAANFAGANLGSATLVGAQLHRGVDLQGATLERTDLRGANLTGANLFATRVSHCNLDEAVLATVDATDALFMECSLTRARFDGAIAKGATFLECACAGMVFAGATLAGATFVTVALEDCDLSNAKADGVRFVANSSVARSNFGGASLVKANFRATCCDGCTFARALLDGADFTDASLIRTSFHQAIGRDVRMVRANLTDAVCVGANFMNGVLQKATVHGTLFQGSNLFRADFAKINGGVKSMDGALITHVRVTPRRSHGQG